MVGAGTKAVLMRIPKEYFEEDKAEKSRYADKLEKSTQTNPIKQNGYGEVVSN
jgi:hypothetical protein